MARFNEYAKDEATLRDQHNNLVSQLNKEWTGIGTGSGTVMSTGAFTTGNFIISNSTSGTSIKNSAYSPASFLGSTATAADSDKLDTLHSTDFVRSTTLNYAEGDWTPTLYGGTNAGTITLTGTGKYTRIGRTCHITYYGYVSAVAGAPSGFAYLYPFPYTPTTLFNQDIFCALPSVAYPYTVPYFMIPSASTNQGIFRNYTTAAEAAIDIGKFTTSKVIAINGTYIIST